MSGERTPKLIRSLRKQARVFADPFGIEVSYDPGQGKHPKLVLTLGAQRRVKPLHRGTPWNSDTVLKMAGADVRRIIREMTGAPA